MECMFASVLTIISSPMMIDEHELQLEPGGPPQEIFPVFFLLEVKGPLGPY